MTFDWSEFLGFAQSLSKHSNPLPHGDEAKYRAAVSRAYYAAHHTAHERLRNEGLSLAGRNIHNQVINEFRNSRDRSRVRIGDDLDSLRGKRVKADYEADAAVQLATAQLASKLAEAIIQGIHAL
ncbi:MAG: DNA-binding protein [Deltaproteobacteria bacterium]|nr:DNA-binding protein [Deltaproteobacteria bacterium]